MARFRKRPVVVEAEQFHKLGDAGVTERYTCVTHNTPLQVPSNCEECGYPLSEHGRIKTLEGTHIVCPGDWIITGVKGERYPCKPDIFELTYERYTDSTLSQLNIDRLRSLAEAAREALHKAMRGQVRDLPQNITTAMGMLNLLMLELAENEPKNERAPILSDYRDG